MPIIRLDPDSPLGRILQQQQTIYYAIVAVPLLLFLMMYLDASQPGYQAYMDLEQAVAVHIGVWLLVLALTIWAVRHYRQKNKAYAASAAAATDPLETKLRVYKQHSLQLYLLLGFLMLLPVAAIWVTGLLFYSIMFLLLIVLIASVRPTVEHFISSLQLSKAEETQLSQRS